MIPYYVIDIETIPCQDIPEDCLPKFDEAAVALGNLKDPFKVKEKIDAARAAFEAGIEKKMSLDPDLCQVCCFVAYDTGGKGAFISEFAKDRDEEFELLNLAWKLINAQLQSRTLMISFNGLSFDLPVLLRRAMIQDVGVSASILDALTRRDSKNHIDLMQALGGRNPFSGKMEFKSLDHYLRRFCLGSKMADWDGSKVYPAWKEGRFDEIVQYCKSDVLNTAALFERVYPWIVLPKAEETKTTTTQEGK